MNVIRVGQDALESPRKNENRSESVDTDRQGLIQGRFIFHVWLLTEREERDREKRGHKEGEKVLQREIKRDQKRLRAGERGRKENTSGGERSHHEQVREIRSASW